MRYNVEHEAKVFFMVSTLPRDLEWHLILSLGGVKGGWGGGGSRRHSSPGLKYSNQMN